MTSRRALALLGPPLALAIVVLFVVAANRSADEAAAWFAAIAAATGVIAVLAAFLGVYVGVPAYRELVRRQAERPAMRVTIQALPIRGEAQGEFTSLKMNEQAFVDRRDFVVRVILHNAGDAVFRWGILNIQVPAECDIRPNDHDRKGHYLSTSQGNSNELEPGRTVPCTFTVAERDPLGHDFLYHAEVLLRIKAYGRLPLY